MGLMMMKITIVAIQVPRSADADAMAMVMVDFDIVCCVAMAKITVKKDTIWRERLKRIWRGRKIGREDR
jgi:hypothetical protein